MAAALAALAILGYFHFPGHTYLQSDTQIYVPMMERIEDPGLFANDFMVTRPHIAYTLYDEATLGLRKLTGLGFERALQSQQIVLRVLEVTGVFLIAGALGLSVPLALLVTAIASLGATIAGPTVLTFEYEPVPRGFAVALVVLATGLAMRGRFLGAGVAGAVAFLYHAPTTVPFWLALAAAAIWGGREERRARLLGLAPLAAAAGVVLLVASFQPGLTETQPWFVRIDAAQEKLQRMRAPYNWVSLWRPRYIWNYAVVWLIATLALWRIREHVGRAGRILMAALPAIGIFSIPLSWLLLEQAKWSLIPQVQPARATLFLTLSAVVLAAAAGVRAARKDRYVEAVLWLAASFLPPVKQLVIPETITVAQGVTVLLSVALAALAARLDLAGGGAVAAAALVGAAVLPYFLIPGYAKAQNYPHLETPDLCELAHWARARTNQDAVFVFPNVGKGLDPGIFRARARRALYVDWKSGGQVNFFRDLGEEWWARWREVRSQPWTSLPVDYVVLRKPAKADRAAVFEDATYVVYRLR